MAVVVGIVAAAGGGERLGAGVPKAFAACAGRPLLEWSLEALAGACDRVVAAVPPGFEWDEGGAASFGELRVAGGASRSESVRLALAAGGGGAEVAVVHDAARPLVTAELVERCVAALFEGEGCDAAVAAARMSDTVKEAAPDLRVLRTLERSRLWRAQTPQAFRADVLRRALEGASPEALAAATDDASLVEAAGGAVRVVEAPLENVKVTQPIDLVLAEALLSARARA